MTDFVCSIKQSGGDYSLLSTWEATQQCNLTAATTRVFSISAKAGTLTDNLVLTGPSGTGTIVGIVTATQVLLDGITGTITSGDTLSNGGASVTVSDSGNTAQAVAECYAFTCNESAGLTFAGWTTGPSTRCIVRAAAGQSHNGVRGAGFILQGPTSSWAVAVSQAYTTLSGISVYSRRVSGDNYCIGLQTGNSDITLDSLILHYPDPLGTSFNITGAVLQYGNNVIVRNCLFDFTGAAAGVGIGLSTVRSNNAGSGLRLESCTFVGGQIFINWTGTTSTNQTGTIIKNIAHYGTSTFFSGFTGTGWTAIQDNATSEASAPSYGTAWEVGLTTGAFTDYSAANYVPAPAGLLAGTGQNLSATFTLDIQNLTRTIPWDIGAYKAAGGASSTITFSGTPVPSLTGTSGTALPNPTPNPSMASRFTVTGGTATYALQAGTLPTGVTIDSATGNLVGTPTQTGTFTGIVVRGTVP